MSIFHFIYFSVVKDVLQIWNIQLISYAGYKSEHDQNVIVGDPGNVSFTQFCQTLGWKGKGHSIYIKILALKVRSSYGLLAYFSYIFISGKNIVFSCTNLS